MNGRLKSLLRLALAEQAFQEADAIIDHILSQKFDPDSHLYQSCVGGLVVSYCRPFVSAQGLGSLPSEFQEFTGDANPAFLEKIHTDLLTARNKIFAHCDLEYGGKQFHEKKYDLHPGEVELLLATDGFSIRTTSTTLPFSRVAASKSLLTFQLNKMKNSKPTLFVPS